MTMLMSVAMGGALGALSRYLLGSWIGGWTNSWFVGGLPFGNLAVNLIGSFLLGVIIELFAMTWTPNEEVRAFLIIGLLGGFTTFSAFSMDVMVLFDRGRVDLAALYAMGSVALAIAGLFVGLRMMRAVLA